MERGWPRALGAEVPAQLAALRGQRKLFGAVASDATARRAIAWIAADPARLDALRAARAGSRAVAWRLGAPPERVEIDIDATLLAAHSEKEGAAGTYKKGFGHHPINAYLDGSREALADPAPRQRRLEHRRRPDRGRRPGACAAAAGGR
jgi:hypothetical protein